nr:hypothetical protein [uncultured Dongia sp.]
MMITMTKFGRNLLCAVASLTGAALLLTGCADPLPQQSRPCPAVKVVQDAAYLTRFAGESEDLAETSFEARIARSKSMCVYLIDTETGETKIRTELSIEFAASRGPKNPDSTAKFNYWVRVTGPGTSQLSSQTLDVEIPFTAAKVQNALQDQIDVFVPLKKNETGDFYRIYVGIAVSEKELAYNRRNPQF